ncbi:GNAT family N-acetyltransferase [Nocardioides sp. LS1]|uniref:GNAT family N-acetyltransferase n=1 Tax=Nocardioides sp. LS1 TaxID=1027620 RepID=UPI000FF95D39|nr:N-acetyltransferase [Nocardioides sp. LS1]GCD89389.1 N-acetyltransferase [Nocardioides sp. LS1]
MSTPTVLVRPARPGDAAAVRRVVVAAFEDHGEDVAVMVEALEAAGHRRASLVAEVDGEVVGHVQLSHSWLDARQRLVDVLVLSPLGVLPAHQAAGIGTRLLAAAVEAARDSGAPAVFLEGSPDYYGARGWQRGSALGFERPSVRIPDPAFQVVTFDAREEWMTGRLIYCDPFWALDCVGLRDPLLATLEEKLARH